ncbi:MAG: DUF5320 domain-containing protein [Desulfobacterales bacterium]|nr:DUF5320 domain-containing protein [Desulfobacterales bacterium]MDD3081086.1 DUF5320 domain-containing protein [Desulfobacterales bacterium]MDD3950223.1 DUF5320 domain-containing protein [Desulfobacterales bacterium]MDD4463630.1 DUF5320 domain-containing protein [Desulfobacterales bacterium]
MPKFDGTGPFGTGPMTGKGDGHCVLKMPQNPDEPQTGFAGLAGKPVVLLPDPARIDSDRSLSSQRCSEPLPIAGAGAGRLFCGRNGRCRRPIRAGR